MLGAGVMTFGGLFRTVATRRRRAARRRADPGPAPGAVAAAIAERRAAARPAARAPPRSPASPLALERLLDELQAAGLEPADVEARGRDAGGLRLPRRRRRPVRRLRAGPRRPRPGRHATAIAREAIDAARGRRRRWRRARSSSTGFDDLTRNQLDLIAALRAVAEVTVALPYEEGNAALERRARAAARERSSEIGVDSDERDRGRPRQHRTRPLLFHLERGFGAAERRPRAPPDDEPRPPALGRRARRGRGDRGRGRAAARRRRRAGGDRDRRPRPGAARARCSPRCSSPTGSPTALEAELPVATTSVGGALIALLEAELGDRQGRATCCATCAAPPGPPPGRVDWFERGVRRGRVQTAAEALRALGGAVRASPRATSPRLARGRRPTPGGARPRTVGALATAMGARAGLGELELRAAAAIATAMAERAELDGLAPRPDGARRGAGRRSRSASGAARSRAGCGSPTPTGCAPPASTTSSSPRCRTASSRAAAAAPTRSSPRRQRDSLGLQPRRDTEAEERYLFHACLALPRRRLFLSYRDSDENGAAEAPSPLLDDVRAPARPPGERRGADDRPRPRPGRGRPPGRRGALGDRAGAGDRRPRRGAPTRGALLARRRRRRRDRRADRRRGSRRRARAEAATRAPGPLANPAVIEALGEVPPTAAPPWRASTSAPTAGSSPTSSPPSRSTRPRTRSSRAGIMHAVLDRLYRERPGRRPAPPPGLARAWIAARPRAGRRDRRPSGGSATHPAERAMLRRVEGLLARFLAEEARARDRRLRALAARGGLRRGRGGRAAGARDRRLAPARRDRPGRPRRRTAAPWSSTTSSRARSPPREKLEEEAKLQLQLYLIAVAELWGAEPVGGLYHPLRGTSEPPAARARPRGGGRRSSPPTGSPRTDMVDREEFEELLADARAPGGRDRRPDARAATIDRDPGPAPGLRGHGVCPAFCDFAPICRRDRAPVEPTTTRTRRSE